MLYPPETYHFRECLNKFNCPVLVRYLEVRCPRWPPLRGSFLATGRLWKKVMNPNVWMVMVCHLTSPAVDCG